MTDIENNIDGSGYGDNAAYNSFLQYIYQRFIISDLFLCIRVIIRFEDNIIVISYILPMDFPWDNLTRSALNLSNCRFFSSVNALLYRNRSSRVSNSNIFIGTYKSLSFPWGDL